MTKHSKPSSAQNPASGPRQPGAAWPIPEPGDVLSYSYLWAREAAKGQEEGLKDRPVVVVLAIVTTGPNPQIIVAPITHSAPESSGDAVEMPATVKRDLGLDRERSWIVTSEINRFHWVGPDVRPLEHGDPLYGAIPDWLLKQGREGLAAGWLKVTSRSD